VTVDDCVDEEKLIICKNVDDSCVSELLADFPATIERWRLLVKVRCYCCEAWPVNEEGGPCERCLALEQAIQIIECLMVTSETSGESENMSKIDATAKSNSVQSEESNVIYKMFQYWVNPT